MIGDNSSQLNAYLNTLLGSSICSFVNVTKDSPEVHKNGAFTRTEIAYRNFVNRTMKNGELYEQLDAELWFIVIQSVQPSSLLNYKDEK